MTDKEFDILEELYFILSFYELQKLTNVDDETLFKVLQGLIKKGWVSCYKNPVDEIAFDATAFQKDYKNYHYLATKAGLLAHNSSDG